ncbi:MAG TPA: zinc ribbon domain-containing protein [Spirochaetota bacterium]|nr:zinc ribbon domain-containing protein [Spirochaetota bacterium]
MPTYEYACDSCGHRFDVFQSMKDEPLKECVKCGKEVRRLIGSGAGIIFKGSGFYVNDYKNSGGSGTSKPKSENAACASCPSGGSCASTD